MNTLAAMATEMFRAGKSEVEVRYHLKTLPHGQGTPMTALDEAIREAIGQLPIEVQADLIVDRMERILKKRFSQEAHARMKALLLRLAVEFPAPTNADGVALIAAERSRHFSEEGWTSSLDDEQKNGELAEAAACYALYAVTQTRLGFNPQGTPPDVLAHWPWEEHAWKPRHRIRNLVRAGALIAAEIDRLRRLEAGKTNGFKPQMTEREFRTLYEGDFHKTKPDQGDGDGRVR